MGDPPLVPKMAIDWFQNDINTIENLSFVYKITLLYYKLPPYFPQFSLSQPAPCLFFAPFANYVLSR